MSVKQHTTLSGLTYLDAPLPWQTSTWQKLHLQFQKNSLPHALLLTGTAGFGQGLFAKALARLLMTQGDAKQTHFFDTGYHPDFFHVRPLAGSNSITVDQIRELHAALSQSLHSSLVRIVLFEPAHALNIAATNALLKLVEEPHQNTFLWFITSCPHQLKVTLRSRCQQIKFKHATELISLPWLQAQLGKSGMAAETANYFLHLAEGAPLVALELADKSTQQHRKDSFMDVTELLRGHIAPSTLAAKWAQHSSVELLNLLLAWLLQVLRLQHQALPITALPPRYYELLCQWQSKLATSKLYAIVGMLYEIKQCLSRSNSMNMHTVWESIFIALV